MAYPDADLAAQDRCTIELKISPRVQEAADILKQFLYARVYTGSEAKAEVHKVDHLIKTFSTTSCTTSTSYRPKVSANPRNEPKERLVVDYIAGMTDRFAIATFERLFVPHYWDS